MATRTATGPPTVSSAAAGRYLYERLGDQRFQQLCNALLAHAFPDVTCFPVGQADGGRDARRRLGAASGQLIYQVKSTTKAIRNPVTWLDAAIKHEYDNITRLVADGARGYYLLTNVAGTGMGDRGSMDRLDERLQHHSRHFGIPMDCWWRADIDARVDAAPREITWAYAEMLAGHDAIRYLLDAERGEGRAAELRELVLKVVATQWQEDAKVKFTQVDLDSYELADLFVDVEAHRRASPRVAPQSGSSPRPRRGARSEASDPEALGGAAAYLLAAAQPLTVVRGEPGQPAHTLAELDRRFCGGAGVESIELNDLRNAATQRVIVLERRLRELLDHAVGARNGLAHRKCVDDRRLRQMERLSSEMLSDPCS